MRCGFDMRLLTKLIRSYTVRASSDPASAQRLPSVAHARATPKNQQMKVKILNGHGTHTSRRKATELVDSKRAAWVDATRTTIRFCEQDHRHLAATHSARALYCAGAMAMSKGVLEELRHIPVLMPIKMLTKRS